MIMIPVDEADAFDRLAIYHIKGDKHGELMLDHAIGWQIAPTVLEVIESDEYMNLLNANMSTYAWVEKAKRNECSAQDVDRANYQRYLAKKALQEKFFPKSPLTETKTERHY